MGTCTSEDVIKSKQKQAKKTQTKPKMRSARTMDENSMKNTIDECFDKFDRNHDGFLDYYEVIELVKHSYGQSGKKNEGQSIGEYRNAAKKLMTNLRLEDESRINRQEFYRFYKNM